MRAWDEALQVLRDRERTTERNTILQLHELVLRLNGRLQDKAARQARLEKISKHHTVALIAATVSTWIAVALLSTRTDQWVPAFWVTLAAAVLLAGAAWAGARADTLGSYVDWRCTRCLAVGSFRLPVLGAAIAHQVAAAHARCSETCTARDIVITIAPKAIPGDPADGC